MLAKIDDYPNAASNCAIKFDFILIDSIQRFSCAQSSISLLNPRGSIILDDSQRDNYKKIFDFFELNGFTKRDFWGIEPGGIKIKNTTFFNQGSPQGGAGAHAPLFNIN